MNTQKIPYELLVRWDGLGAFAGTHVQFRYVTTDLEGKVLGEFIGPAEPVTLTVPETDMIANLQARIDTLAP